MLKPEIDSKLSGMWGLSHNSVILTKSRFALQMAVRTSSILRESDITFDSKIEGTKTFRSLLVAVVFWPSLVMVIGTQLSWFLRIWCHASVTVGELCQFNASDIFYDL